MNNLLSLDFGERHIGLCLSYGELVEPAGTISYKSQVQAIRQIVKIINDNRVTRLILGISEGKMAERTKKFAACLEKTSGKKVIFQDETLSSQDAKQLMIKGGFKQRKRQKKGHEIAACLILRSFILTSPIT